MTPGTFFFVSSVLVNCQGSLIVAGGCEQWRNNAFLTFRSIGTLFFCGAVGVLVFGRTGEVRPPRIQERLTACTFRDSRPSTMCSSADQIKDWVLLYSWLCCGLFPRITSICSTKAEPSFGATSSAFMFSLTCSGRLAPVMTVLTFGFFRHQASAN